MTNDIEMEPGRAFKVQAQAYRIVGTCEHLTLGDRWIDLLVVESTCPDCGELFHAKATKSAIRRREVTRRCESCRKPGVPVDPNWQTRKKARARIRRAKLTRARNRRRLTPGKDRGGAEYHALLTLLD